MVKPADLEEKRSGRLPLILLGVFAIGCLAALILVGDLARYQETATVEESQAALRDVKDVQQLNEVLKRHPSNRILKLVALAAGEAGAIDAATRTLLDEAAPAALLKPASLTGSSRGELDSLRRDLKAAESNAAAAKPRAMELIKKKRNELESAARSLGIEHGTVVRFVALIDKQYAELAGHVSDVLAARGEYYAAYEKCAALLVREFGSYKVTNGQFIFRLQPTADSYNAASTAMTAATARLVDLDLERDKLRQSRLDRWKKFVDGK